MRGVGGVGKRGVRPRGAWRVARGGRAPRPLAKFGNTARGLVPPRPLAKFGKRGAGNPLPHSCTVRQPNDDAARCGPHNFVAMPHDVVKAPIPALRQQLADEILAIVGHLNPVIAASLLCIDEQRMADLRYRPRRFSVERLIRMLAQIDRRVDLTVVNTGPPLLRWFRILRERQRNFRDARRGVPLPIARWIE